MIYKEGGGGWMHTPLKVFLAVDWVRKEELKRWV